ncbi:GDPD3 isoform 3, partial [Pongo abelii]
INRTYFPFSCSCLNQLLAVVSKWWSFGALMKSQILKQPSAWEPLAS